jgi:ADP-ribose pyrophosphatase YjhB (NUDIX family)
VTAPRPELCVGAVAVVDDRLLLVERGQPPDAGRWSIPGGRVERGETVREAVVRELREETGLESECGGLVGWTEIIGATTHFVILDFRVTVTGGTLVAGDDAAAAEFFPIADRSAWPPLVTGLADFLVEHAVLPTGPSTGAAASRRTP